MNFTFASTSKLFFGSGKLSTLHSLSMPGKKALVVISNGKSTRTNGSLDRTLKELETAGVKWDIYDRIGQNPLKADVENGAIVARENECDFIVGLGGGSVLDASKVIAMNCTNPGNLWQYAMSGTGGRITPVNRHLPWIAIPTTAGTGSEVDIVGIVTNPATKEKLGIFGDFSKYAIVDPQLTLTVPKQYTIFQGFDALFHSLEGHISNIQSPMADMIQEKAIKTISQYLPVACSDGSNLNAREMVSFASTLSGYSMVVSSCTAEHAIEHALSAYHEHLPHGAGLLMISKAFFSKIISQHVLDERFVEMARWMGCVNARHPEDFITALETLKQKCDVPKLKMNDYGITPAQFNDMATNAMTVMERCWSKDVQPLNHDEIVKILTDSYEN